MRREIIGNCELYLGDCLEILPDILPDIRPNALVTDPVWPNNSIPQFAHIEPYKLFDDAWKLIEGYLCRAVIQLGCDSDPYILKQITLPFFRVAWLEYAVPGHKGRILYTGDVAYMFGTPPKVIPGKKLISGKFISNNNFGKEADHPCPRKLDHVKWLVYQFTDLDDIVLDPFMGSGTTGVACVEQQRKFIGIEINEKYFDIACKRIEEIVSQKIFDFGGTS
jgi:site-specific DNA-methyltransferase (adenine-specific)/modification methylase